MKRHFITISTDQYGKSWTRKKMIDLSIMTFSRIIPINLQVKFIEYPVFQLATELPRIISRVRLEF